MPFLPEFEKMIDKMKAKRKEDKLRFEKLDDDLCMCCHAYGQDKRSLFIDCFYAVDEVIPEAMDVCDLGLERHQTGFYLRICKNCRGRLLKMLGEWWSEGKVVRDVPKDHDGYIEDDFPANMIPVRMYGTTVLMQPYQYEQYKAKENGETD